MTDNKPIDKLLEGVDEKLKQIDADFDAELAKIINADKKLANDAGAVNLLIQERRDIMKEASDNQKTLNYDEERKELQNVTVRIDKETNKVYKNLVDVWANFEVCVNGLAKFQEVISSELNLPIKTETSELNRHLEQLAEVRSITTFMNVLTENNYTKDIQELELDLYAKLAYKHFQLQAKEKEHSNNAILHTIKEPLQDLVSLMQKNLSKQQEVINILNKKQKK